LIIVTAKEALIMSALLCVPSVVVLNYYGATPASFSTKQPPDWAEQPRQPYLNNSEAFDCD
jgi:hypothetical protein